MERKIRPSHRLFAACAAVLLGVVVAGSAAAAEAWTQLAPSGTPPLTRNTHSVVYDPTTNQMIVFGGRGGAPSDIIFDDVWRLTDANGVGAPAWILESPAAPIPAPRWIHRAVYDEANDRMIVFGGGLGRSSPCANDVWVLEDASGAGGTPTWNFLISGGPAPRFAHSAVYDPDSNRLIVFGGSNCFSSPSFGDLWVLSNANGLGGSPTWTSFGQSGSAPGLLVGHTAVYDSANNRMIVFGGWKPGHTNNVWVLTSADGTGGTPNWSLLTPSGTAPAARMGHSAVYDAAANEMIVFGGQVSTTPPYDASDVWVLSDANGIGTPGWTQLLPSGASPAARTAHTAVFDADSNRMVIFGGGRPPAEYNDVWVLSLNVFSCAGGGFEPPFYDALTLKQKTKRAIPVQMVLEDSGVIIMDLDLAAPPVVDVDFSPSEGGDGGDVTDDLLPLGQANDDNMFRFDSDELKWVYNLGSKPFEAAGTYTVRAVAGDPSYMIDASCTGTFDRLE